MPDLAEVLEKITAARVAAAEEVRTLHGLVKDARGVATELRQLLARQEKFAEEMSEVLHQRIHTYAEQAAADAAAQLGEKLRANIRGTVERLECSVVEKIGDAMSDAIKAART